MGQLAAFWERRHSICPARMDSTSPQFHSQEQEPRSRSQPPSAGRTGHQRCRWTAKAPPHDIDALEHHFPTTPVAVETRVARRAPHSAELGGGLCPGMACMAARSSRGSQHLATFLLRRHALGAHCISTLEQYLERDDNSRATKCVDVVEHV